MYFKKKFFIANSTQKVLFKKLFSQQFPHKHYNSQLVRQNFNRCCSYFSVSNWEGAKDCNLFAQRTNGILVGQDFERYGASAHQILFFTLFVQYIIVSHSLQAN